MSVQRRLTVWRDAEVCQFRMVGVVLGKGRRRGMHVGSDGGLRKQSTCMAFGLPATASQLRYIGVIISQQSMQCLVPNGGLVYVFVVRFSVGRWGRVGVGRPETGVMMVRSPLVAWSPARPGSLSLARCSSMTRIPHRSPPAERTSDSVPPVLAFATSWRQPVYFQGHRSITIPARCNQSCVLLSGRGRSQRTVYGLHGTGHMLCQSTSSGVDFEARECFLVMLPGMLLCSSRQVQPPPWARCIHEYDYNG